MIPASDGRQTMMESRIGFRPIPRVDWQETSGDQELKFVLPTGGEMQSVEICDSDINLLYCPFCGMAAFTAEREVQPCPHMVFVSSNETPEDPWYIHPSIPPRSLEQNDDEVTIVDALNRAFPEDDKILFILSESPPAALDIYLLYSTDPLEL